MRRAQLAWFPVLLVVGCGEPRATAPTPAAPGDVAYGPAPPFTMTERAACVAVGAGREVICALAPGDALDVGDAPLRATARRFRALDGATSLAAAAVICAARAGGVTCVDPGGTAIAAPGLEGATSIAIASTTVCSAIQGQLRCADVSTGRQGTVLPSDVVAVASPDGLHVCALRRSHDVVCIDGLPLQGEAPSTTLRGTVGAVAMVGWCVTRSGGEAQCCDPAAGACAPLPTTRPAIAAGAVGGAWVAVHADGTVTSGPLSGTRGEPWVDPLEGLAIGDAVGLEGRGRLCILRRAADPLCAGDAAWGLLDGVVPSPPRPPTLVVGLPPIVEVVTTRDLAVARAADDHLFVWTAGDTSARPTALTAAEIRGPDRVVARDREGHVRRLLAEGREVRADEVVGLDARGGLLGVSGAAVCALDADARVSCAIDGTITPVPFLDRLRERVFVDRLACGIDAREHVVCGGMTPTDPAQFTPRDLPGGVIALFGGGPPVARARPGSLVVARTRSADVFAWSGAVIDELPRAMPFASPGPSFAIGELAACSFGGATTSCGARGFEGVLGPLEGIEGLGPVDALSPGGTTCAIVSEGRVACWDTADPNALGGSEPWRLRADGTRARADHFVVVEVAALRARAS